MTTIQYINLTMINNIGITNNKLVRDIHSLGLTEMHQDSVLLQDLIRSSNDFIVTKDSTNNAITDILLLDKHKLISKQIERYINNL